jgi:hypothetical protein
MEKEIVGEKLADLILDSIEESLAELLEKFGVSKMLEKNNSLNDFLGEFNFSVDSDIKNGLREVGILSKEFKQEDNLVSDSAIIGAEKVLADASTTDKAIADAFSDIKQAVLDPFIVDDHPPRKFDEKINQQLTSEMETDCNNEDGRTQITLRASISAIKEALICQH